jgi:ORF6N domain
MENEKWISIIQSKIYRIRGIQVMLDNDLAKWYETETKFINSAVKRNLDRFPAFFCFQMTKEESEALRFQNGTLESSKGRGQHRKFLPMVFSEQGVAMLSAVLNSKVAVQVSVQIICAFVELRKRDAFSNGIIQRVEGIEYLQMLQENKLNQVLDALGTDSLPKSGIFFNDQIFDAYVFSSELIKSAKRSLVLIDNYIDEVTFLQLSKRKVDVDCTIYTEKVSSSLQLDLSKHNAQFPAIILRRIEKVHDRFLIIDDEQLYHLGASLKDLGKRWFAFSRMDGWLPEMRKRLEEKR